MYRFYKFFAIFLLIGIVSPLSAMPLSLQVAIDTPFGMPSNVVIGSSALKPLNTHSIDRAGKGRLGEDISNKNYIERLENDWEVNSPRKNDQGLDHLALKFNDDDSLADVLVAESKFTKKSGINSLKQRVHGRQLSRAWVEYNIHKDYIAELNAYLEADLSNSVKLVSKAPEGEINSKISIGKDSYYYKDSNGKMYFYSENETYTFFDNRNARAQQTKNKLLEYIQKSDFRRVLLHTTYDSATGIVTFEEIHIVDGIIDKYNDVSVKGNPKTQQMTVDEFADMMKTKPYRDIIKEQYGFTDTSFLDEKNFTPRMIADLVTGENFDKQMATQIFKKRSNRVSLSKKLNVNPSINYSKLSFTDSEWSSLIKAESINDPEISNRVREDIYKASTKATITTGLSASFAGATLGGVTAILSDGIRYGFDKVDWNRAIYSAGVGASVGILNTIVDASARAITRQATEAIASSGAKITSTAFKMIGKTMPLFLVDTIVDVGYGLFSLYNGTYSSGWQAAADIGINLTVDIGLAVLGGAVIGGPVGAAVAIAGGAIWSFGSYYIISPITNSIEINSIFRDLHSNNRDLIILDWTRDALNT